MESDLRETVNNLKMSRKGYKSRVTQIRNRVVPAIDSFVGEDPTELELKIAH